MSFRQIMILGLVTGIHAPALAGWSAVDVTPLAFDELGVPGQLLGPAWERPGVAKVGGNVVFRYDVLTGLVTRSTVVVDTIATAPPRFMTFDAYVAELIDPGAVRNLARASSRFAAGERRASGRATEGLVPDISIPVKLPGMLGDVIGQGGNIRVAGHQKISLSGDSNYEVGRGRTDFSRNSKFPDLGMEQELVLNLTGTVGEKVSVDVDHNSTASEEQQNKIRITYDGDEDEIIQRVEAGDTQLSLPSTRFVGVSAQSKGLFGLKAEGKVGDLDITIIASKEKGNAEEGKFLGQATLDTLQIHDIHYLRNRFFALELSPADTVAGHPVPLKGIRGGAVISDLKVFYDDNTRYNDQRTGAVPATVFLDSLDFGESIEAESGTFVRLVEQQDYIYNVFTGAIEILSAFNLDDSHRLGVAYEVASGNQTRKVGLTNADTLQLKLLKEANPRPDQRTWPYMFRNRYDLGARNIPPDGFVLAVERILNEAGGLEATEVDENEVPYLQVLGLDPDGDGRLNTDLSVPENQFALETGILTIPDQPVEVSGGGILEAPFPFLSTNLDELNGKIYDERPELLRPNENAVYRLRVAFVQIRSSFSLGHLNVLPNSEVVRVDGRTLVRDKDYFIIYEVGQITFVDPPSPTSRVTIDYEYAPFFDLAQKTLVGTRASYRILDGRGSIGTTWLYESQRSLDQRPRVGREVGRINVGDVDAHVEFKPGFLTEWVDALPLVESSAPSRLRFEGELAASLPNPNVRDYGYVDDMEAVETTFSLLGTRRTWGYGSTPYQSIEADTFLVVASGPGDLAEEYGSVIWYNPDPGDLPEKREIYDDLPVQERNDRMTVMRIDFDPRGETEGERVQSLLSIQRPLSSIGVDFANRKFVEAWIAVEGGQSGASAGVLHIDLGAVDEDQNRRNRSGYLSGADRFDTEDQNLDGTLQLFEDTGLDGIDGPDGAATPNCGDTPFGFRCDDGTDDYNYQQRVYRDLNGTEANNTLDTEDLDEDGVLDREESFFRFTIDLGDPADENIVEGTERSPSGSNRVWRQYRIPLAEADTVMGPTARGAPDLRTVKQARLWYEGCEESSSISLASLDIVGSTWLERRVRAMDGSIVAGDEFLRAASVNARENTTYRTPSGVEVEKDAEGRTQNEQALVMRIENLRPGHEGLLVQPLYDSVDYTLYGGMELFVHGGESSPDLFVQFGADSLNYYEWRIPVTPQGEPGLDAGGWSRHRLDFQELTLFKEDSLSAGASPPFRSTRADLPVSVIGRPSLTRVKRLVMGVRNNEDPPLGGPIIPGSGQIILKDEVWVDDLRLTDVRKEGGFAARSSMVMDLSDLASVNASIQFRDSEFHGLGSNRGQGADVTEARVFGNLDLDRVLPARWGIRIPVRASYNQTDRLPRLAVGSDVILDEARAQDQASLAWTRDMNASFSKRGRSSSPWVDLTLNRISARGSMRQEFRNSYSDSLNQSDLSGSLDWEWSSRRRRDFTLFGPIRMSLLPSNVSFGTSYTRRDHDRFTRDRGVIQQGSNVPTVDDNMEDEYAITYAPFRSFTLTHGLSRNRDRTERGADAVPWLPVLGSGREDRFTMRGGVTLSPRLPRWGSLKTSWSATYDEDMRKEIQPPPFDPLQPVRNLKADSRMNVSLSFKPALFFKGPKNTAEESDSSTGFSFGKDEIWNGLAKLEPLTVNLSRDVGLNDPNATGRAPWSYRLGYEKPADEFFVGGVKQGTASDSRSLRTSTGARLPKSIVVRGSFSRTERYSLYDNAAVDDKLTVSTTLPDVSVTLGALEKTRLLELYAKSSSLTSGFQRTISKSGSVDEDGGFHQVERTIEAQKAFVDLLDRDSETIQWKPLAQWQATWKNDMVTTLTHSRSETFTRDVSRTQLTRNASWRGSLRYTLETRRGIDLPVLGRVQLDSDLRAGLETSIESTATHSVVPGVTRDVFGSVVSTSDEQLQKGELKQLIDNLTPDISTMTITVEPTVDYSFSRSIDGGLQFRWSDSRNRRDERTIRDIKITIWTMFRF